MIIIIDGKEEIIDGRDIYLGRFKIPEGKEAKLKLVEETDIINGKLIIPEGVTSIMPGAIRHLAKYIDSITGEEKEADSIKSIKSLKIPDSLADEEIDVLEGELELCGDLIEASIPYEIDYMLKSSFNTMRFWLIFTIK